jgi:hypothetical protein
MSLDEGSVNQTETTTRDAPADGAASVPNSRGVGELGCVSVGDSPRAADVRRRFDTARTAYACRLDQSSNASTTTERSSFGAAPLRVN